MDFAFTEEQLELKRQARAWLSERYPLDRDWDGKQDDRWSELAELGWLGVSVAEDEGGAGLGFLEEALLFEELGYALYPGPYLGTVEEVELRDLVLRPPAVREHVARLAAQQLLLLGECKLHGQRPRGRPSTRSAMMLRRTSLVPASIVLPRERSC